MITRIKTKKWGNSIGIVIPKETIEAMRIKLGESIIVDIQKKESVLRELFGSLKFKKPTKRLLDEVRKDLEGKWINQ
ncbi:spoVT / AbrB like domain protein [archaeon BMS3Abin17]|nr:spoVT / AbrB like domain protein [archaeon BMS3Abin17]HDZ61324.1 AbrB/MazE/SpoVT family DNA-binding domain-containing protein [Candidatus Pacearchaeota archaeon]